MDSGAGPLLTDAFTGETRKTWFFAMTLCWSRHQHAEFVHDQGSATWLACHRRAFEWFGGVPGRVIIDNAKRAITKACIHDPEVQRAYAGCAEGHGFRIDPCPPHDPQKKGIVESGVKYIKRGFLPLRELLGLADANRQLAEWVLGEARRVGPHCLAFVEGLFADAVLVNLRAAQAVLRLEKAYGAGRLEAACARAVSFGSLRYRSVKVILAKGLDQAAPPPGPPMADTYSRGGRFCRDPKILLH